MDKAIRWLVDKEAVLEAVNDLFLATDARDWTAVRAAFAPLVRLDMTSLAGGEPRTLTPAQIAESWERGLAPLAAVHHQTGNFRVRLGDGEADVFCYGTAYHVLPSSGGRDVRTIVGSYDIHLVRRDAAWSIDAFRFTLAFAGVTEDVERSG